MIEHDVHSPNIPILDREEDEDVDKSEKKGDEYDSTSPRASSDGSKASELEDSSASKWYGKEIALPSDMESNCHSLGAGEETQPNLGFENIDINFGDSNAYNVLTYVEGDTPMGESGCSHPGGGRRSWYNKQICISCLAYTGSLAYTNLVFFILESNFYFLVLAICLTILANTWQLAK